MSTTASTRSAFERLGERLDEIRAALRTQDLDGWLLYDLHARNPVAAGLLGQGDLSRRWFVLLPAHGDPVAVIHGIEEGPWLAWPWDRRQYVGWRELEAVLREVLGSARRVAMEVSPGDAVPFLDLVPAGVVELIRATGPEVVTSGELITRFHSRWSPEGLESHRRSAEVVAGVARSAFGHLADRVRAGEGPTEGEMRAWVCRTLAERGLGVGVDCIVANGVHAADPHYQPQDGGGEVLERGDLVLLDLWGKETEDAVFADQTWMAFLGPTVPERAREVWGAVRDARDAAVAFIRQEWRAQASIRGWQVDDAARAVIRDRGFGPAFIHRTGHSIDRAIHGMGPNIDNLETRDVRALVTGVGFSIEPGVYLSGEIGIRSEINVYMGEDGPEVTPREIQREIFTLLGNDD